MELLKNETLAMRPAVLPENWAYRGDMANGIYSKKSGHSVIWSVERHGTARWVHLSIAHPSRVPSYQELASIKNWIMPELKAIQVFAPLEEHVNIHQYCLHLWACLDGDPLPDFRRGGMI